MRKRRTQTPVPLSSIEQRCSWLATTLDQAASDEIVLLRRARTLKAVHADLQRALRAYAREQGWTYEASMAQAALSAMEQDLRRAHLDHQSLRPCQIHAYLTHAMGQASEALELLLP
jgi:hypothetical protein